MERKNAWRAQQCPKRYIYPLSLRKSPLFFLPGIKSTQGVTYHRSTGKINNHIYPDVDRTVGIELTKVKTSKYKDNHVGNSYKKYCEPKVPSKIIEGQHKQRQKWQKDIDKKARSNWIITKPFVLVEKLVNYCWFCSFCFVRSKNSLCQIEVR